MRPILAQILDQQSTCGPNGTDVCPNTLQDLEKVFTNVLNIAIPLAGIVVFIILLLAGVNLIMAGSDPKKAEAARNMATYAILGLVALALSYLLLVIVARFVGLNSILNFRVFIPFTP